MRSMNPESGDSGPGPSDHPGMTRRASCPGAKARSASSRKMCRASTSFSVCPYEDVDGRGVAGYAELLGSPKPEEPVAAGLGLELLLLVEGVFLLKTFLALVECGHDQGFRSRCRIGDGRRRCGNSPPRLDKWREWLRQRPKSRSRAVKLTPAGPDRLYSVGQSVRLDVRLGSRSVSRPWPSRQLRRGSHPSSYGAHQLHGFQQHTVHPNEPSTPHL